MVKTTGAQRSRIKTTNGKDENGDISITKASSSVLSESIESDQLDIEVQSPMVKTRGAQRSRIKKTNVKDENGDISITKKRATRSRR